MHSSCTGMLDGVLAVAPPVVVQVHSSVPTWFLILQVVAFVAAAVGVAFAARQVRHNRAAREATALQYVATTQQDRSARHDRKTIYDAYEAAKRHPVPWTAEQREAIGRVAQNFDVTAILVREGALREQTVLRHWGRSVRKLWPICQPVVEEWRRERDDDRWLHSGFEWLAARAGQRQPKPFKLPTAGVGETNEVIRARSGA